MPYKRGPYKRSQKRALTKKYGSPKRVIPAVRTLQAAVRRAVAQQVNKNIETKQSVSSVTDGIEIFHNNFVTLSSTPLFTSTGTGDPMNLAISNRIGDRINIKGVSMKMMIELNERYSDVTFRLLIVRAAKGDIPTRATLFAGISGNKMIDNLNTERYTILHQKFFKIKAGNHGNTTSDGAGGPPQPSGYGSAVDANNTFSRATRLVKVWVPGTKFVKSGILTYEDGSAQPKFFDYHVLLYAYSNWTTLQDIWFVARVNDFVNQMYFKDA